MYKGTSIEEGSVFKPVSWDFATNMISPVTNGKIL